MIRGIGRIITFFLNIMIIAIFTITIYFCLEFFEIITVPEKYSVLNLFFKKIEDFEDFQDYVQTAIENKIFEDDLKNTDSIIVELEGNNVKTIHLENGNEEQVNSSNTNNFRYYDQLNEVAQIMYDALEKDKDQLKTGTYTFDFDTIFDELLHQENGSDILNNSFQLAVNAFSLDYPEIFYIDITKMYLLTETTTRPFSKTHRVSIGPSEKGYLYDEYKSFEDVDIAINQINQIKEEIKQNVAGSDYDKIKYIHDYFIESTEYEKEIDNHNNYNIYGTLINKKAVCEGYAKAFKYILDDLQIPCIMVFGVAQNSAGKTESHAWNYVYLDNRWYAIDVTWDDPIIIGPGYLSRSAKYKYFLKGSNSFFGDHVEDGTIVNAGTFVYPALSETDY